MKVLVPLLSGKEADKGFIDAVTSGASKVILLQIVDKAFMGKASAAMGEVMQFSGVMAEAKKIIGAKKKSCDEITEWGNTSQKIVSIALLQKIDKVCLVRQSNRFFGEVVSELEKNKLKVELIDVRDEQEEQQKKKKKGLFNGLIGRI